MQQLSLEPFQPSERSLPWRRWKLTRKRGKRTKDKDDDKEDEDDDAGW